MDVQGGVPITVQEMEHKSGLDRANIRFYEKEGLLEPKRRGNGYRDYSEADLQLLLKIKLLRQLGFSIESIRSMQQGNAVLEEELERRLDAIRTQRQEATAAEQVCAEMKADRAAFHTLDTQRYFRTYARAMLHGEETGLQLRVPDSDRVRSASVPWRRYFARWLDLAMMEVLLCGVLVFGFGVNWEALPRLAEWLLGFLVWALLFPFEALCISRWGATPGKALMGISVEDEEKGRLLSFGRAAERTWEVFCYGIGYNIPIYSLYRSGKSYKALKEGREPEWDYHIAVIAQPYRHWRTAVYAVVSLVLAGLLFLFSMTAYMPNNRGKGLTEAQFVENYNQLSDLQNKGLNARTLLPDGTIVRMNGLGELVTDEAVQLQIDLRDGVVTGISYERTDSTPPAYIPDGEGKQMMRIAVRAWAWADADLFSALGSLPALEKLMNHWEGTLELEVLGYRLIYMITPFGQTAADSDAIEYHVIFHMSRVP